jgi:hypothetical protein
MKMTKPPRHSHRLLIPDRTLERDVKKLIKDRILTNLKVP